MTGEDASVRHAVATAETDVTTAEMIDATVEMTDVTAISMKTIRHMLCK